MSEIRYDRLFDKHVIIAPERLRHSDFYTDVNAKLSSDQCPFCAGNEQMAPREIFALRISPQEWLTRVIPNRTKVLAIEAPYCYHDGDFGYWDGFGAHEIIIDSPHHYTSIRQWNSEEIGNWFKTLRARIGDLRHDSRLSHFSMVKNEGIESGASVEHCHTQIIALPFIPHIERSRMEREAEYYATHRVALIESILRVEEEKKERVVATSEDFTAFCPYASSSPFEIMISSKRYLGGIDSLNDHSICDLSTLLKRVLEQLEEQLGDFSSTISILTPHPNEFSPFVDAHRLIVRILPRIYRISGFELESQISINPVSPENAAQLLRGDNHG